MSDIPVDLDALFADDPVPEGTESPVVEEETPETGNELRQQFLEALPEELRDSGAQLVPHWDKFVTKQFQDASEVRNQYEPFKPLVEQGLTPEEAQWYMENRDAIQALSGEDGSGQADENFQLYDEDPRYAQLEARLNQQQQTIDSWQQERQQQEQQSVITAVNAEITQEISSIKEQYPTLTREDADAICTLAGKYATDANVTTHDIVTKGFADFQRIAAHAEQSLFSKKVAAPNPTVQGGRADTSSHPIVTFEDAAEAAAARVRQALAS